MEGPLRYMKIDFLKSDYFCTAADFGNILEYFNFQKQGMKATCIRTIFVFEPAFRGTVLAPLWSGMFF